LLAHLILSEKICLNDPLTFLWLKIITSFHLEVQVLGELRLLLLGLEEWLVRNLLRLRLKLASETSITERIALPIHLRTRVELLGIHRLLILSRSCKDIIITEAISLRWLIVLRVAILSIVASCCFKQVKIIVTSIVVGLIMELLITPI
jgi:hypothetical protein